MQESDKGMKSRLETIPAVALCSQCPWMLENCSKRLSGHCSFQEVWILALVCKALRHLEGDQEAFGPGVRVHQVFPWAQGPPWDGGCAQPQPSLPDMSHRNLKARGAEEVCHLTFPAWSSLCVCDRNMTGAAV